MDDVLINKIISKANNTYAKDELLELHKILGKENIQMVILKGAFLNGNYSANKISNDLDIWVYQDHLQKAWVY